MRQEDIDKFGFELFEFVFTTLDGYFLPHEMDSKASGRIAGTLARAYRVLLDQHFNQVTTARTTWAALWGRAEDGDLR